jgi:outer membrane receptor protein involved in Fe transport
LQLFLLFIHRFGVHSLYFMKPLFTFILISLHCCFVTLAQSSATQAKGSGKISGIVTDSDNNAPVEFATIALNSAADNKSIDGTVADGKGKFIIAKVPEGMYTLVITFIGYETQTINNIKIGSKNDDVNLGIIKLSTSAKLLNEVVVEGKKDLIEERVDRTIYNAENDATTKGGDATDVLKRVPLLSVDLDGNVSLRGSSNIQVLINNKPSTIVASSVADALKQIPADQIKTVEVITSPSAKYDAEGSGGIINIITKKNNLQGLTLNIDAGVGYRGSNLGLNGNYRKKKMGFSLGGFGRANYNVNGDFENKQFFTNNGQSVIQKGENRSDGIFGNYTLGWDYDINKKNSLAASVRYGVRNGNSYQDNLTSISFLNSIETGRSLSNNQTTDQSGTVDVNFTYTHLFEKPQQELSVLALYSRNDRTNDFTQTAFNTTDNSVLDRFKNLNDGLNEESTIQLDYQTPIGDNQMLEMGLKEIRRSVFTDFSTLRATGLGSFVESTTGAANNQLNYDQDVTSGYLSYTRTFKKSYSLKAGARYEYTTITAFSETEDDIAIPEYGVLVPSVNASKKLKSGNTVKASYNRRIQRPSIQFLNPNKQITNNPLFQTIGEPTLDPEFTNNYEVGYSTFIKGSSLNFSAFYRSSDNAIQSLRTLSPFGGDTIITRYANIGREQAYGSSIFANVNIGKLSLSGGGDVYYALLDNNVPNPDERASNEGWVPSGRLFGGYSFEKGWGLQFFGFYRGRRVLLQGVQGGFGIYSVAVRKDFANKKGSFGVGIENFLAKSITIRNETTTNTIDQRGFTTQNNVSFRFNISYRIGKLSFDNQPRRRKSINNDDLKDGGDGGDGQQQGGGTTGGQRGGGGPTMGTRPATTRPAAPATPIDPTVVVKAEGKWAYTVESPQGGSGVISIKKEGANYSGTITSNRNPKETPLTTVVVKGNELTITYNVSFGGNSATIQLKGTISGDALTGDVSVGQFGTFPMNAKRSEQ